MRISRAFRAVAVTFAVAAQTHAQSPAPAAEPLVLLLPVSTRAIGLGDVSGRDDYSIFYNPALIAPTNGIGAAFGRYDSNGTFGALASSVSVGPVTYGWGVELLQFRALTSSAYPYAPADLVMDGTRPAVSLAAMAAAEYTYKRFNIGVGVKFAEDRVDAVAPALNSPAGPLAIQRNLLLADIGTTHALFGGTAEFAVQNIGDRSSVPVPTTAKLGFTRAARTDQFDFAFAGDVTDRQRWIGGGGGAEIGYGWIEGWSAALRAGARRPETSGQRPVAIGGTLNADRLVLDYALEFFDSNRYAHHITVRWR
jgi:hypothetical protein